MFKLFITELQRHRVLAASVAALHFMVLYYLYTLGRSVLQTPVVTLWMFVCIGMAAGFGVFQMSLYKRDNDWLYLLHRPLAPQKVFMALTLAGVCVALLVTIIPLASIVMVMSTNPAWGIEFRHYTVIAYTVCIALCSYFCGCYAILSASRLGFLALSMTTGFVMINVGSALWIGALLLLAWGFLLARVAFKPDLSQPPRSIGTLLLTELPIQYGCLWLIILVSTLAVGLDNYISNSDPSRNPRPGTDYFVRVMPPKDAMQMALANAQHTDAAFLRQQVLLGETMEVSGPTDNSYPQRHQMPRLDESLLLNDVENNVLWHFSHTHMLFEGRDARTGNFAGWLGTHGFLDISDTPMPADRFNGVPWTSANEYIISNDDIYQVDWDDALVHHRYHDEHSDRFAQSLTIGDNTAAVLSDSALYLFSSGEFLDATVSLKPKAVLPLPPTSADLRKLVVLPLIDGYLVSALLDMTPYNIAPDFALIDRARLQLYRLRQDQDAELISSTPLPTGLDPWFFYRELVLAPGMRIFTDLMWGLRGHKRADLTLPLLHVRFPAKIWLATALVSLLSAGITASLLRRSTLPLRIRLFWIVANGLTGVAGLLSFFIGYYWRRPDLLMIPAAAVTNIQKQG